MKFCCRCRLRLGGCVIEWIELIIVGLICDFEEFFLFFCCIFSVVFKFVFLNSCEF